MGATALIAYGIARRSRAGAALATAGGLLAFTAAKQQHPTQSHAHATFLVNASPEEAYALWRDFANLPRFMRHLKSVRVMGDGQSEWVALGPLDREIRWTADMTEDVKNERISWRSLPGSMVQTSGSVDFRPHRQGRGTYVRATVRYEVPNRTLATGFATVLGKHPEFMVREDLRRFKALLETGEVPTTLGQPHGPRGAHGWMEQALFRETSNLPDPQSATEFRKTA